MKMTKVTKKEKKILLCAFLLGSILAMCIFMGDGDNTLEPDKPDKIGAITAAQYFVESQLISPSSAKFPWGGQTVIGDIAVDSGRFKVESYVDSQNAFGAMVRQKYWCVVQYDAETEEWVLESLSFE